jgi:hypothetical protein
MIDRVLLTSAALLALTGLPACTKATPEKVLRIEGSAPLAPSLCERMAEDYDMVVAETSALRGTTWRASLADRFLSARGINWAFRVDDEDPADACASAEGGMTCQIAGPATFSIQSEAGRATYMVVGGDRATVTSQGATISCVRPPEGL